MNLAETARWALDQALYLMDEISPADGRPEPGDYSSRALPILNTLCQECWTASDTCPPPRAGVRAVCPPVESLDEALPLDDGLNRAVLPYGLAAHLLLDENPELASYFQQCYEQNLERARRELAAVAEEIPDPYGGIELGQFGRW